MIYQIILYQIKLYHILYLEISSTEKQTQPVAPRTAHHLVSKKRVIPCTFSHHEGRIIVAIRHSQQSTSPGGFLFEQTLLPPPCAVLLEKYICRVKRYMDVSEIGVPPNHPF